MAGGQYSSPEARPFLKWAGSKKWLIPHLKQFIPKKFNRYYEPFLGSGAVFFALKPERAQLSDLNENIIITYKALKRDPGKIIRRLRELKAEYEVNSFFYYYVRDAYKPRSEAGHAARIIFLNRTCWNGLYRENGEGEFNVPLGSYSNPHFYDIDNLRAISKAMERARIRYCDFEKAVSNAVSGDFIFFDPPYITGHNDNGFHAYNEDLFKWDDQERLAYVARRLFERGCYVLITNAARRSIRRLYKEFRKAEKTRHSLIAAKSQHRKLTKELLIKSPNY